MSKYSKGSEWRVWDLHVHTPASELNNGFGNDWDNYVKTLFKKALENSIAVIGITDYFTIEGYKKIKNDYLENDNKLKELFSEDEIIKIKEILILPNIEFRLDKLVDDSRVNFHVIFSNEVSIQDIEENFLHELNFSFEGNPQGEDEQRKLKTSNLISLGERLKKEHSKFTNSDLFVGMMNAVVSDKEITDLLSKKPSLFKGKYLLAIPSDEDLSKLGWNNQAHLTRKILIQKSDCLFSSNSNTIKWGLGKFEKNISDYISEFKSLKPCVWGSDSHTFDELFTKNEDRKLWVKSDPTYEGLKQIIYEPEERVRIGNRKPDEKKVYDVIDKVKFLDPSFTTDLIEINENLTTIIGGKSTGKSILIKSIAQTTDKEEYNKRNQSAGLTNKRPVQGFQVFWKDGQISNLNSEQNPQKRIIYIPQSYLNRVVDEGEVTSDIDEIIQDVLMQKTDFKDWYEKLKIRKKEVADSIEAKIKSLFENININISKNKEKKEIGDADGIKKQIDKLNTEIKALQDKAKLKPEELDKFNTVSALIKSKQENITIINKDIERLKSLNDLSISFDEFLIQNINNKSLREEIQDTALQKTKKYKADWSEYILEKASILQAQVSKLNEEIKELDKSIISIKDSLKEQKVLSELLAEKSKEEKILSKIEELTKEITSSYELIKTNINSLCVLNSEFYSLYLEAKKSVNLDSFDDELSFSINTIFRKEFFQSHFVEKSFDGRTTRKKEFEYLTNYSFKSSEDHKEFLNKLTWDIIKNTIPKRDGINNREILTSLFQNWFLHDYQVTYQNDDISEMSPGKKSFVLLRLLIDLDDSHCPILIDQPEDDLDNRSIYSQVVSFLRKRKKTRQIIIVTHNPNLVLGADSEEVIIANQEGEDTKNKSFKFEYVSGSIEDTKPDDDSINEILYKRGIQEHVCDILEGGREAFDKRKKKYNF